MRIHILGICGTFMGGVALLAKQAGFEVSGSDEKTYPPMSDLLAAAGIDLREGYDPAHLQPHPDLVVIGNALSRGNPAVEYVLNERLSFTSGPRWLGENYLRGKRVIAVAGTHGKTTTASLVAWLLEADGRQPGFLIGGVPGNFSESARDGQDWFVVEADEYDTAFFDKRAKFVHYRPWISILNNLEFDHADIYPDLAAIETQFHHLVRTIPGNGLVLANQADEALERVLERGCWSELQHFGAHTEPVPEWSVEMLSPDGSALRFFRAGEALGEVEWPMTGEHNALNALAAVAAVTRAGCDAVATIARLAEFRGVRRRQELLLETADSIRVIDDFAHHPTAIRLTLQGLRRRHRSSRLLVALEPRSNSMRSGVHQRELGPSLAAADRAWIKVSSGMQWDPLELIQQLDGEARAFTETDGLLQNLLDTVQAGDTVVFMSNGGFDNLQQRFVDALTARHG